MSARDHTEHTPGRSLWLGALGVVLAGLFGMHGLDSHGASGAGAAHVAMVGPETAVSSGHEVTSASAAAHAEGFASSTLAFTSRHPAMAHGMELTCMAILAVALLTLLRQLRGRRAQLVHWMLSRPVRATAFMGRDPDPPSLTALSIQRC